MKLVTIKVKGIYGKPGSLLPASMARLTPDAARSLMKVEAEIEALGGCFRLTDAYRSSAMQSRAHDDYIQGRKLAYSPPAGLSMHEAGRAIDLDLAALIHTPSVPRGSQTLNELQVRAIFESHGWTFIAPAGNPHLVDVRESWHIEFRGPFQSVYDAVLRRTGSRSKAYQAMAAAAIAGAGDGGRGSGDGEEMKRGNGETERREDGGGRMKGESGEGSVERAGEGSVERAGGGSAERAGDVSGRATIVERLKSSTTLLQSLGIQMTAVGAAAWSFISANTGRLLYVLGGSAFVSLVAYAIYTWKEVQTKRIEAGQR